MVLDLPVGDNQVGAASTTDRAADEGKTNQTQQSTLHCVLQCCDIVRITSENL